LTLDSRLARLRRAVTLIELLIVMLIITILAGLILGVAAVAGETARESQSKHTVLRLHKLLMDHYDTYKTRRVKVRDEVLRGIELQNWTAARKGQAKAAARLYALRELMIMEIPDRWSDITLTDNSQVRYPYFLDVSQSGTSGRTALSSIYLRRCQQATPTAEHQGAECLYLVITLACGEGEARSQFGEDSIGDTDGDGAYEFLDGWGHPINFLRWASGFDSQVQIDANTLDDPPSGDPEDAWNAAASGDHDPFDLYRVHSSYSAASGDRPAFRLVPLILSSGRDESFGIRTIDDHLALRLTLADTELNKISKPADWLTLYPNPYLKTTDTQDNKDYYLGTAIPDSGAADNIHNHLLGRR
jgi:type II secretory pathway pseudopilin PulG